MKILLVTSEALPFAKSGGLGDFIFSYGKALAKMGQDVSVIMPLYKPLRSNGEIMNSCFYDEFDFMMSWRRQGCGVFTTKVEGITYYFTAMDRFDRDSMYGYGDDKERFACFIMAVNTFITRHNDFDVVHCNDWQSAVLPLILTYNPKPIKTVLTIHNPAYQGWAFRGDLSDYFNLSTGYYDSGYVRLGDSFNYLKTGIMSADKINTVSKTHAQELLNDHSSFGGLGAILDWCRHNDFTGIVNGLDVEIWNPQSDKHLAKNYSIEDYREGKKANKKALYKLLGIPEDFSGPLYSAITRLSEQKGVERIIDVIPHLNDYNARLVIIGTGEMEEQVQNACNWQQNVTLIRRYDEELAHLVYAASDFFLMPSRFEPCGTSQMISMRYGTLPLVSNVGGLNDTVKDVSQGDCATGFVFDNNDYFGMVNSFYHSVDLFRRDALDQMIQNGIRGDYSWQTSAKEYLELYNSIYWK